MTFDLVLEVSHRSDNAHELRVRGTVSTYRPARVNCPNEYARPAEGGDIEDLEAFLVRGKRERPIPDQVIEELRDTLEDKIWEHLNDN